MRYPVSRPSLGGMEALLLDHTLQNNQLTAGPMVQEFERLLAGYLGVQHAVAVCNGTAALHLALVATGIGPGDEVMVPDLTYVATANAVTYTGAKVVLVDVDPDTWCIDPAEVDRKQTSRTKAILPVHLYGAAAPMAVLKNMRRWIVIEDNAEGFGGAASGFKLGSWGDAATLSFYGNKIITTGEGGAVVTDSRRVADRVRSLRGHAMDPDWRYYHTETGFNYRMTDLQAAVGVGQMSRLEGMLERRRKVCAIYRDRLALWGSIPTNDDDVQQAPWLFTFAPDERFRITRDSLAATLAVRGIETRPAFVPLHRMPMFGGDDEEFPAACARGDRGISLPTYAELTESDVHLICDEVIECFA
jgi:perosamine synthetase